MIRLLAALLSGLVFGAGIALSGMINPAKVLNFFDFAGVFNGTWDPSLAFVMGGALAVTIVGYQLVLRRPQPLLDDAFRLPTNRKLDLPLITGSVLFGVGWGIAGFCPGGSIPALGLGETSAFIFVASMLTGITLSQLLRAILTGGTQKCPA